MDKRLVTLTLSAALLGAAAQTAAQPIDLAARMQSLGAHLGPVVTSSGAVFTVPDPDLAIPEGHVFKAVFEITDRPGESAALNRSIDSAARFLNMHVEAGVPLEDVQVAVVIHGASTTDVLNNAAYRERFGVDNPNLPLFDALKQAGARLYVCAQAAHVFQVPRDQIAESVEVALSAMTAMVMLQSDGYQRPN
jgi:intracellular sulfur oxidation DsrE/DsrF family protein